MSVPFVDLRGQYRALKSEIDHAVLEVLDSSSYILGRYVERFEDDVRAYLGVRHAIGLNSGTDALVLSLLAAEIGPGDEVLTVSNSFFATAEAVCLVGARPVFVDVDERTYNLDPAKLEAAITERTKAIIPVHLYGQPADLDAILAVADRHRLAVVEDACQAIGATYRGKRVGGFGLAGCFSFVPAKNLGAFGDGGMVVTDDDDLAARIRVLRDHGSTRKYVHQRVGYNSRLDAVQAAALSVKLRYLDEWNAERRRVAARYDLRLRELDVVTPFVAPDRSSVYHLYVVRAWRRDSLQLALRERGIETLIHYPVPIHLQQAFEREFIPDLPVTESLSREILSLPTWPLMTDSQVDEVVDAISEILGQTTKRTVRVAAQI